MNITRKNTDELNAVVTLQLSKEDYQERVDKVLADYRRKARIDGFRPGKVPAGIINKMYGKAVLVEEINKLISEKITDYIKAENLHVLGDPLPSENQGKTIDWENDTTFEFTFDMGFAPAFETSVDKKDKLVAYEVKVDDEMVDNYISSYTRRFGRFVESDAVEGEEMLKGDIAEVDKKGNLIEGGITNTEVSIYLELAKDEKEKKAFKGAKVGDAIVFDVKKAFPNDFELSNILKVDKEKVADIDNKFQFTIRTISKFEKAELNQELFDKVYGENTVTSEEEFKSKVTEEIRTALQRDSKYRFTIDTKKYFLDKYKLALPSAFLKRWVEFTNEGKISKEQIEKEFPMFEEDMKWQLIKNKLIKAGNIEVTQDEVVEQAKEATRNQFRQYGINNIPDEQLDMYAVNILKKEADVRRMVEQVLEDKIFAYVKDLATIDTKLISNEDFGKLFQ